MDRKAEHALEVRAEWAELLRAKAKSIEARSYPLPQELVGKRILICVPVVPQHACTSPSHASQSPQVHQHHSQGPAAPTPPSKPSSALPDSLPPSYEGARMVGWVTFGGVKQYESEQAFLSDEPAHRVPPGSPFGWGPGDTQTLYGWSITDSCWHEPVRPECSFQRIHRSIFKAVGS